MSFRFFFQYRFLVVLCVVFSGLYLYFFENRAYVTLEVEVDHKTWFEIYWADKGAPYSEENQGRVRVYPHEKKYVFFLTNLEHVDRLRIDPIKHAGTVLLKKIQITQKGFRSISLERPEDFSSLTPVNHIKQASVTENGLNLVTSGEDPQLEFFVNPSPIKSSWILSGARVVLICLILSLIYRCCSPLGKEMLYVPFLLMAVFSMIVVMAGITKRNVHPDEYVHIEAAKYYQDHWMPPVFEDPTIRNTYSVYGVSRLNKPEVYYFLAGKFTRLLESLHIEDYLSLRFFNVMLFGIILCYAVRQPDVRVVAVPLLLTSQLWYIFSYCDSDAFSLFICFLVACQLLIRGSALEQVIRGKNQEKRVWNILWLGVLFGLFLLIKKNYYVFSGFGFFFLLYRMKFEFGGIKKQHLKAVATIFLIGIILAGARFTTDYYVNGWDKNDKIDQMREQLADPLYKPSTDLHQKHAHLYRKSRGDSLQVIIQKDRWFEKTFRSAFGVFGYFTVASEAIYYDCVRWVGLALFLLFTSVVVIRGGTGNILLLSVGYLCSAALIAASLMHSWMSDFQPQGRYLFPIIPILSILYYQNQALFRSGVFNVLYLSMFVLSVYSFIFAALLHLPLL